MDEKLSPMMRQYLRIKEKNSDCLLLYRLGDFYELFFDDAKTVSDELGLTLTGRSCGQEERAPMCGVPYHSVNTYIEKLLAKGYKIAICEQLSDPKTSKGMVERDVVRIITPGTVIEDNILSGDANNFIASIFPGEAKTGLCYADVSTGAFFAMEFSGKNMQSDLLDELYRINPKEIILPDAEVDKKALYTKLKPHYYVEGYFNWAFDYKKAKGMLSNHFGVQSTLILIDFGHALCACGALLYYLDETQKNALLHIDTIKLLNRSNFMVLDEFTRANLELTRPLMSGGGKRSTLMWLLDNTRTSMGARFLRSCIDMPLLNIDEINMRLDSVETLLRERIMRDTISQSLSDISDIERICAKIAYTSVNARDCVSLLKSLAALPKIKSELEKTNNLRLASISNDFDSLMDICELLSSAIANNPPISIKEGGIIKPGYDETVDKLRAIEDNSMEFIAAMEDEEKKITGIKNLKISSNRVFGYYIEVSKGNLDLVPYRYERKQTLANAERFITKELKELEEQILTASDKRVDREYELFTAIRDTLLSAIPRLKDTALKIAELDFYLSLASVADINSYVRPNINCDGTLTIIEGRHPVVEKNLNGEFVSNDTEMDFAQNRVTIITGPNMAGKSTYLRQTALIVLLAHIGSFVPAKSANIPITDRIFTRVGAYDNLSGGQSTFMVEMSEMASILNCATRQSLLILDEIGRGTSTYDGLSIAWAVLEYVADEGVCGAKTLFATHYHELSEFEDRLSGIKNYKVLVKEAGDDVIFLRKVVRGSASKSFGIEVAKLAGLPKAVISRARTVLAALEEADITKKRIKDIEPENFDAKRRTESEDKITAYIKDMDINRMTPLEALGALNTIKAIADEKR